MLGDFRKHYQKNPLKFVWRCWRNKSKRLRPEESYLWPTWWEDCPNFIRKSLYVCQRNKTRFESSMQHKNGLKPTTGSRSYVPHTCKVDFPGRRAPRKKTGMGPTKIKLECKTVEHSRVFWRIKILPRTIPRTIRSKTLCMSIFGALCRSAAYSQQWRIQWCGERFQSTDSQI